MATYDPVSTATALAENYVYARQTQLDNSTAKAQSQSSAVTSLRSALTTFTSALNTLSGKDSVIAQTTKVSNDSKLTATAASDAAAGQYSFVVEKLATAQQTMYAIEDLGFTAAAAKADGTASQGFEVPKPSTMTVSVGNNGFFAVDLGNADTDNDGQLSAAEIARAVNAAADGKVTAAVITHDGKQQLLLNAASTGEDGAFKLSNVQGSYTQAVEGTPLFGTELVKAENAVFRLGGASGQEVTQASNTYTAVSGLSVEFKATSTEPVTVTVAKDDAATKSNMQGFVDAYNTLVKALDKLTASGNAESGVSAGAMAGDSSVRSLRSKINNLLRTSVGGVSLTDFGISSQRDGTIALDGDRFAKKLAANPDALDTLLGKTNTLEYKRSGVMGSLQTYVESWTKTTGGHLQARQDSIQKQQANFSKQQSAIDRAYEQAYQRYLLQFSTLSSLEDQMSSTSSMLSSMFSSSDK